ncbi:hypothetical protein, partial [uncultured Rikenella sp.]|uniref:hypothetical protein n=1 Tax=uncultured Rikenella sp. TaxID=368003 RepID=UPI0026114333
SALSTLLGSSSPLGNLQTAFALRSLAASVVNKENQKNFMIATLLLRLCNPQFLFARLRFRFILKDSPCAETFDERAVSDKIWKISGRGYMPHSILI